MTADGHNLLEERRLETLYGFSILDTPDEAAFNQIADDVKFTLKVPMVLINFVDRHRVWFKACITDAGPQAPTEGPRQVVFCSYTIQADDALVVPDLREDPRFKDNPLVTGEPFVRAYAGVPLITDDGFRIGTVCCLDFQPRDFTAEDIEHLRRARLRVLSELSQRLLRAEYGLVMGELQTLMNVSPSGFLVLDEQGKIVGLNPAAGHISGRSWQPGEAFTHDLLTLDGRIHAAEPTYARPEDRGWFTVSTVQVESQPRTLVVFEDVTDHVLHQLSLSDLAFKDALTGLPNRNRFYHTLEHLLHHDPFVLGFLDLDGFKNVNDTFGHHTGDALLQEVAGRLESSIRIQDQAFRLAGDEFTLLLRGELGEEELHHLAERLLMDIQRPFEWEGASVPFGASVGFTRPQPEDTVDTLLSRADGAMYHVKKSGKNHFRVG